MYFGQKLLIIGGKNSAVEAALRCHQAGARVSISYRRERLDPRSIKYWLLPEMNGLIESGRIQAYFNTIPQEITPSEVVLRGSRPEGVNTAPQRVPADFVLSLIGYEADLTLLKMAGVELRNRCQSPVYNEHTMETTVRGLYVAGTAIGGTQDKYTVFIENCHVHAARILAALTGAAPPPAPMPMARPES